MDVFLLSAFITLVVAVFVAAGVDAWLRRAKQTQMPAPTLDLALDALEEQAEETISVAELEREYAYRSEELERRGERIRVRTQELQGRDHESLSLQDLIAAATSQERANLAAILKLPQGASATALAEGLGKAGSHMVGTWLRGGRGVEYDEVVHDVAAKLKVPEPEESDATWERERQILTAAFDRLLEEASPEQREAILAELASQQQRSAMGVGAGTAAMVVANLSGFALYTAASTTLAAITGAVGLTLPFATYMGLSSVLATITGPVGWAALAAWAVASLGGTNYKKTIPAVILVGTVRSRLIAERDQELEALAEEEMELEQAWAPLEALRAFLDALDLGDAGRRIPVSDVPLWRDEQREDDLSGEPA